MPLKPGTRRPPAPRFLIQVAGRYGFIDRSGREIVAPTLRAANHFHEGLASFLEDGAYGFLDTTGHVVIAPSFEAVDDFREGRAVVTVKGKLGVIDRSGALVIEPAYDELEDHYAHVVPVVVNGKAGLLDKAGNWRALARYDEVLTVDDDGFAVVASNKKWGLLDRTGTAVIPARYAEIGWGPNEGLLAFRDGKRWGVVDRAGQVIVAPSFEEVGEFSFGRAFVRAKKKLGYIDRNGALAVPIEYASAFVFREKRGAVQPREGGPWGFIDVDGYDVVPAAFEQVAVFSGGLARVRIKGRWGCISASGRTVIDASYDEIAFPADGFVRVVREEQAGFVSVDGRVVIPTSFASASDFREGLARVDDGYIDHEGRWVWRRPAPKVPVLAAGPRKARATDFAWAAKRVAELSKKDPRRDVFGASVHQYALPSPLDPAKLVAFEKKRRVKLPTDYRAYVLELADGGAGPYYGVYSLAKSSGVSPRLDEPFVPLSYDEALARDPDDVDSTPGLLRISDQGCGHTVALVVSGDERGTVWTSLEWGWLPASNSWATVLEACNLDYEVAYRWTLSNLDKIPRTTFYEWYATWVGANK